MANQIMAVVGCIIAYVISLFVPLKDDEEANTTNMWSVMFLVPGIISLTQMFLMILVYKYDTPIYYSIQKDDENYKNAMSMIYKTSLLQDDDETSKPLVTQPNQKELSWAEIFSPPYRHSLIVCLTLSVVHQATGISSVTFYSNEIFMEGMTGAEAETAARLGTLTTGGIAFAATLITSYLLKILGRKPILVFGILSMGITLGFLFNYSLQNDPGMVKIFICLFVFLFNLTIAGILWIYASETLSAKGVALVAQINMIAVLIFG
mmetsp:Transcript_34154/g.39418  ORF Transcript_34154/g.39418 Transcript_34154/m.39418 type:complete len:264 (+) Transcript_34154:436-1227(+)